MVKTFDPRKGGYMDFKAKIEGFATHQVISLILDLLGRSSDENLIRLTYLGEKLTSDEEVLSGIAGLRRLLKDPRHPAKRFGKLADQVWQNEYLNPRAEPEVQKTDVRTVSQHLGRVQRDSRSVV